MRHKLEKDIEEDSERGKAGSCLAGSGTRVAAGSSAEEQRAPRGAEAEAERKSSTSKESEHTSASNKSEDPDFEDDEGSFKAMNVTMLARMQLTDMQRADG